MNKNLIMKLLLLSFSFAVVNPAQAGLPFFSSKNKKKTYQLPSDQKENAKKKRVKKETSASLLSKFNPKDSRVAKAMLAMPRATLNGVKNTKNGVTSGISRSYRFLKSDTGKECIKISGWLVLLASGGYYMHQQNQQMNELNSKVASLQGGSQPVHDEQLRREVQGVGARLPNNIATQADVHGMATGQQVTHATANLAQQATLTALDAKVDEIDLRGVEANLGMIYTELAKLTGATVSTTNSPEEAGELYMQLMNVGGSDCVPMPQEKDNVIGKAPYLVLPVQIGRSWYTESPSDRQSTWNAKKAGVTIAARNLYGNGAICVPFYERNKERHYLTP